MKKQLPAKVRRLFFLALAISVMEITLFLSFSPPAGDSLRYLMIPLIFAAVYGKHFFFHVKEQLPSCYDKEQMDSYSDGIFHLKIPGVTFNNRNWPHIVKAIRLWCIAFLLLYPPLFFLTVRTFPILQERGSGLLYFLFMLGSFSFPPYFVGRKYE